MKGIILADSTYYPPLPANQDDQQAPITCVYNKPMVYYPVQTLEDAGMNDILIVSGRVMPGISRNCQVPVRNGVFR